MEPFGEKHPVEVFGISEQNLRDESMEQKLRKA
jgi:hypothetical protein